MAENSKFISQPESMAGVINGETPAGEQMLLGNDVFIFAKFLVFEQPVLNRLRANKEGSNLFDELDKHQGVLYLGESDAIREELHKQIDGMFNAIAAYRKNVNNAKSTETK